MIKILFLTNNLGNGGAERVLVNLANELSKDPQYSVTIRCLSKSGPQIERLSDNIRCEGIIPQNWHFRGINYLYLLPHRWIYKKVVGGEQYDVIIPYLHGVLTKIISYAPKEQKTIAYLHANMENSPFIKQLGKQENIQRLFNSFNRIVAVSNDVKESFVKVSGIKPNRVSVVYNTFAVEEIKRLSLVPVNLKTTPGKIILCSVGKLEEVKGYKRLVDIVKRLRDDGFNFVLTIVGEGPEHQELDERIESMGITECIHLIGYDKNPYKYIQNSDLFVCSSYSEGFSSVVAESLILGVPVVTTECAGMKEMLGNNNEYGVVTDNSGEALYEGMKRLLSNPDLLAHYKKNARERSTYFSPEQTVVAVERMIEEVLHE